MGKQAAKLKTRRSLLSHPLQHQHRHLADSSGHPANPSVAPSGGFSFPPPPPVERDGALGETSDERKLHHAQWDQQRPAVAGACFDAPPVELRRLPPTKHDDDPASPRRCRIAGAEEFYGREFGGPEWQPPEEPREKARLRADNDFDAARGVFAKSRGGIRKGGKEKGSLLARGGELLSMEPHSQSELSASSDGSNQNPNAMSGNTEEDARNGKEKGRKAGLLSRREQFLSVQPYAVSETSQEDFSFEQGSAGEKGGIPEDTDSAHGIVLNRDESNGANSDSLSRNDALLNMHHASVSELSTGSHEVKREDTMHWSGSASPQQKSGKGRGLLSRRTALLAVQPCSVSDFSAKTEATSNVHLSSAGFAGRGFSQTGKEIAGEKTIEKETAAKGDGLPLKVGKLHAMSQEAMLSEDDKVNAAVVAPANRATPAAAAGVSAVEDSSSTVKSEEHSEKSSESVSTADTSDASSVSGRIESSSNSRSEDFVLEPDSERSVAEVLGFEGQCRANEFKGDGDNYNGVFRAEGIKTRPQPSDSPTFSDSKPGPDIVCLDYRGSSESRKLASVMAASRMRVAAVGSSLRKNATGAQTARVPKAASVVSSRFVEPRDLLSSLERDSFMMESSDDEEEMYKDETQAIERLCAVRQIRDEASGVSTNNEEDDFSIDFQDNIETGEVKAERPDVDSYHDIEEADLEEEDFTLDFERIELGQGTTACHSEGEEDQQSGDIYDIFDVDKDADSEFDEEPLTRSHSVIHWKRLGCCAICIFLAIGAVAVVGKVVPKKESKPLLANAATASESLVPTLSPTVLPHEPTEAPTEAYTSLVPTPTEAPVVSFASKEWSQLGPVIDRRAEDDLSGFAISMSSNGLRLAVGARRATINKEKQGNVRIFDFNTSSNAWIEVASFDGHNAGDQYGYSVSLSGNGKRVAIGAPGSDASGIDSGQVDLLEETEDGGSWTHKFQQSGESSKDLFGLAVSLTDGGDTIAVGAPYFGTSEVPRSGRVYVYEEDNAGSWDALGSPLEGGKTANEWFGWSVSVAEGVNERRLAVGSPKDKERTEENGVARVFGFNEYFKNWSQTDLFSRHVPRDRFGWSVSISSDGERIAIGSPDGGIGNDGLACVYNEDPTSIHWSQIGDDILAEEGSSFGFAVILSADGRRLAVGAPWKTTGHVGVFEKNGTAWEKSKAILGDNGESLGTSLAMSNDGRYVASGAPNAGVVRVFV